MLPVRSHTSAMSRSSAMDNDLEALPSFDAYISHYRRSASLSPSISDLVSMPIAELRTRETSPPVPAEIASSRSFRHGRVRRWLACLNVFRRRQRQSSPRTSTRSQPSLDSHSPSSEAADVASEREAGEDAALSSFRGWLRERPRPSRGDAGEEDSEEVPELWSPVYGPGLIETSREQQFLESIAGALRGRRLPQRFLLEDEEAWTYEQLLELDRFNVSRGLKPRELWALVRHKMTKEESTVDCQICLCSAAEGELLTTLPCSHVYHDSCIAPWFKTHRTCPICRFEIRDASSSCPFACN